MALPFRASVRRSMPGMPHTVSAFGYRPGAVERARCRLREGDDLLQGALADWLAKAERVLQEPPSSVVDKPQPAGSGDPHDYLSHARYYWPNPATKDGMPYVKRDGETNPEIYSVRVDKKRLLMMKGAAETLGLAYALTGNEAYAEHAARHLRAWFIAPATRMNPHLDYAQVIPGTTRGRVFGVIEGQYLLPALDAAALLSGSVHWSAADRQGLSAWAASFLEWLLTSFSARREAMARNNHGTFYDVQKIHLALFAGDTGLAARTAEAAKKRRIAGQIRRDGAQPYELRRSQALHYSQYNLSALFKLATRAEHVGIDLWSYQSRRGASIRRALDFLMPYLEPQGRDWPYPGARWEPGFGSVLLQASDVYREPRYAAALQWRPGPVAPGLPDLIR